jgi:hypothetical protein
MLDTYLTANVKDVGLVRWPTTNKPVLVYIAPFRWYEADKQAKAQEYELMVWQAFGIWSQVSQGAVTFQRVAQMNQSQINVVWRRVDRRTLGHCEYSWDKQGRLYSAEISIGLTDGKVHNYYNNPDEVKRTIIHEVGHALGLGHSDNIRDVMYPTHQIGVNTISQRDADTLRWLYRLSPGFNYQAEGKRLGLAAGFRMDDVVQASMGHRDTAASSSAFRKALAATPPRGLPIESQQDILTKRGQYFMMTSHIEVEPITPALPMIPLAPSARIQPTRLYIPPPIDPYLGKPTPFAHDKPEEGGGFVEGN